MYICTIYRSVCIYDTKLLRFVFTAKRWTLLAFATRVNYSRGRAGSNFSTDFNKRRDAFSNSHALFEGASLGYLGSSGKPMLKSFCGRLHCCKTTGNNNRFLIQAEFPATCYIRLPIKILRQVPYSMTREPKSNATNAKLSFLNLRVFPSIP